MRSREGQPGQPSGEVGKALEASPWEALRAGLCRFTRIGNPGGAVTLAGPCGRLPGSAASGIAESTASAGP